MGRFDVLLEWLLDPQILVLEDLQPMNVLASLAVAAFCGLIIFLVYRFFHRGALYSESFNLLIIMVCVITSFIIITIGTNLVLTLGMVGALSVVRFRAAVKDPLDVGFLFWGVGAGLTAGARLHLVALIGTAFIAILYLLFIALGSDKRAFLLIVRYSDGEGVDDDVKAKMSKISHKLKNKTIGMGFTELTVEVKVRKGDTSFLRPLKETSGVDNVVLVEYTGDYT
ncbi:MAG: DUF4956 domain-containing protein [Oscillospiraceae bacterium]|nr:DUF4956 domain-containing protein [Oscillospiraceae bacterium]MCL2278780.1 DUF4956 domain-containing protein [Oscillospiraceae bacterium]